MNGTINRQIFITADIPAPIAKVWEAWTTTEGCNTFFAPSCKIKLKVGGAFEMYFTSGNKPGLRGGEGCTILAIQPERMLSFTWNAPADMPTIRAQFTHVSLYFDKIDDSSTKLTLIHDGWGTGEEWDTAFQYFQYAWGGVVLPRLVHRFKIGPIDWDNPNAFRRD
jgi:uncharacterized protein YndB with AHSA1/START domain